MKMTRGDTKKFKFKRQTKDGQVITNLPSKMYITFKKHDYLKEFVFQKRLDEGITYNNETNYYHVVINPEDTCDLHCGCKELYYDIEILVNDEVKTINKGVLEIETDITCSHSKEV